MGFPLMASQDYSIINYNRLYPYLTYDLCWCAAEMFRRIKVKKMGIGVSGSGSEPQSL
jgi:hypothetical protein